MSSQRRIIVRDLAEEAKKRIVVLGICIVGLSYLMSMTSSSVWVNFPAAASLVVLLRYFVVDYEMRKKTTTYNNRPPSALSQNKPCESGDSIARKVENSDWRTKINSPVVEDAVDHFARHLVSEWVTNLWYSKLTPDLQGPEELVHIIDGVIGELSCRLRNINVIELLTRDLIGIICNHLERFRATQSKIELQFSDFASFESRDEEIRVTLATEDKLHPALYSPDAQHKVLQHLMDGLVSLTCRPEDLQCSLFRYICRELLASTIMRPILNMANPRFINERIENFVLSKANKEAVSSEESSRAKSNGEPLVVPSDHFTKFNDPTGIGVELVPLKNGQPRSSPSDGDIPNGHVSFKDPLLSIDTRSSHSWNSLPLNSQISTQGVVQRYHSGGEWGELLDNFWQRKNAALAPENIENMWTKGVVCRNSGGNKNEVDKIPVTTSTSTATIGDPLKRKLKLEEKRKSTRNDASQNILGKANMSNVQKQNVCKDPTNSFASSPEYDLSPNHVGNAEYGSNISYTSEEDDPSSVTGLDSPGTKVWDGKKNRNVAVSHIRHPLETPVSGHKKKIDTESLKYQQQAKSQSRRKRSRTQNANVWHEVERTSFLSGDGQDILRSHVDGMVVGSSSDSDLETRVYSGATASSSTLSLMENHTSAINSLMVDSFIKLKSEVLGANIVKSGSKPFAVYSISVLDVNNNNWSIKRRFRHFEELHRRLKEYPEYDLHLPPKHFLSPGLDMYVIQERCQLLDQYLKKLLQLPTISGSIEVWDFLSVDSQTYYFSNSFSIVETLSVSLDHHVTDKTNKKSNSGIPSVDSSVLNREQLIKQQRESVMDRPGFNDMRASVHDVTSSPGKKPNVESNKASESYSDAQRATHSVTSLGRNLNPKESGSLHQLTEAPDSAVDSSFPAEWVPPNVTLYVLNLVDVILQLQDSGWIRRKSFWVIKQILHLGMGDALDNWLLEKIQLLRRGSVIALLINRVEELLWPDGIFISKHPKRRPPNTGILSPVPPSSPQLPNSPSPMLGSPKLTDEQQLEANRRAKFVYDLLIDNAPAPIVGLVGRKEYEQSAKDLFLFIQSSVCLKLLAFDLLELLLLTAFPEMDNIFRQVHEEKHRFGDFIPNP